MRNKWSDKMIGLQEEKRSSSDIINMWSVSEGISFSPHKFQGITWRIEWKRGGRGDARHEGVEDVTIKILCDVLLMFRRWCVRNRMEQREEGITTCSSYCSLDSFDFHREYCWVGSRGEGHFSPLDFILLSIWCSCAPPKITIVSLSLSLPLYFYRQMIYFARNDSQPSS